MSSRNADTSSAVVAGLTAGLVVLDGRSTGVTDIVRLADGAARPVPGTEAMKRVEQSWDAARQIAATGRVYGRSTGVGANRNEDVPTEAAAEHGLRLLRSHAGAIGEELPARQVRAMLAVRANQLLAGGAGLRPTVVTALCEALETGAYPVVNEFGSVGTGDIAALAQVGLALVGSIPGGAGRLTDAARAGRAVRAAVPGAGRPAPGTGSVGPGPGAVAARSRGEGDVLRGGGVVRRAGPAPNPSPRQQRRPRPHQQQRPHLGQSALALDELRRLIEATQVVAALSLLAVDGSHEAYAAPVHAARPHQGSVEVARRMRELIGAADRPTPPLGRIQDPYGFRCVPQIHGPAQDAADALEEVLVVEINAAAENPSSRPRTWPRITTAASTRPNSPLPWTTSGSPSHRWRGCRPPGSPPSTNPPTPVCAPSSPTTSPRPPA